MNAGMALARTGTADCGSGDGPGAHSAWSGRLNAAG